MQDNVLSKSAVGSPYTFTGREYDPETGLYYYRARYYDPKIGRFLQEDPIWDVNLYSYAGNSPLNWVDPWGWCKEYQRSKPVIHAMPWVAMILPDDPSGLSPDWSLDPTHRNPNGQRFRDPSGRPLDWNPGRSGKPGWDGFHDAVLQRIDIDYLKREAKLDFGIDIANSEAQNENSRDAFRSGRLTLSGFLFCIIEPPDSRYLYQKTEGLWIADSGPIKSSQISIKLPAPLPEGTFAYYFYVNNLNSYIYLAARDVHFEWSY